MRQSGSISVTMRDVTVLLGDSSPSDLPPDILTTIKDVVLCARNVATPYAEAASLERRRDEATQAASAVIRELDSFAHQTEIGVRATAGSAKRPEIRGHAEEIVAAIGLLVDDWKQEYADKRDAAIALVARRNEQLYSTMLSALERFLLPRRTTARLQRFRRMYDGRQYVDTAVVEPMSRVLAKLAFTDAETPALLSIQDLIGRGHQLQIGVQRNRIRRVDEPIVAPLDGLKLLDVERVGYRLRLLMAPQPGSPDGLRVEIVRSNETTVVGRATQGNHGVIESPPADAPVLTALWNALAGDCLRIVQGPTTLVELALDGRRAADPDALLDVAERVVDHYRPTIAMLANHSPNSEELAIKIVTGDGRREETWIRRDDLAQHLLGLSGELRGRLGISELYDGVEFLEANTGMHAVVTLIEDEGSSRIRVPSESAHRGVPGAPVRDLTEDISLGELLVDSGPIEQSCVEPTQVRSR